MPPGQPESQPARNNRDWMGDGYSFTSHGAILTRPPEPPP